MEKIPLVLSTLEKYPIKSLKVADIHFGFNNNRIIKLLGDRGQAISQINFQEVEKIENEISEYIKVRSNFARVQEVVSVFVTFAHEDGRDAAIQFTGNDNSWVHNIQSYI